MRYGFIGFSMDLVLRDLGFAMKLGQELGVPLDQATRTLQAFNEARTAYGGDVQSTQAVKLLEGHGWHRSARDGLSCATGIARYWSC